jgi:hypothetical protein
MALVLNQADLLAPGDADAWRGDAARLLDLDGLAGLPLLVVSAETGQGLDALRRLLAERVSAHDAALARLAADVDTAARRLEDACGGRAAPGIARDDRERLVAALEEAAGVPAVVRAVDAAHRRRGALAAGWPYVRWVRRLRPDPLRRLRLPEIPSAGRTSLPPPTDVQRAQVGTASRRLADRASDGLPPPWPGLARRAALAEEERVAERLERAVAGTELRTGAPRWWRVAGGLQKLLALAVLAGGLWLLVLAVLGYLRVDEVVPLPEIRGVPVPTWLLVGGALLGVLLALAARAANGVSARRRARAAGRALRERVDEVADELVVAPVEGELEAYAGFCAALGRARAEPRRRLFRRG